MRKTTYAAMVTLIVASTTCAQQVFAAATSTLVDIVDSFTLSLSRVSSLLLAVALMVFLWGVLKFIFNAGDEKERSAGRLRMVWGVVGLALIVALWGVVYLLRTLVGTNNVVTCPSPQIDITTGQVTTQECL